MTKDFSHLGVDAEFLAKLVQLGIKTPMPVQAAAVPAALKGRDIVAQARTGTGKTLAFLLPALQKIDIKKPYPQVLIIAPTRELAAQIADEAGKFAGGGVKIATLLGGRDFSVQKNKLEGAAHLLIGTPGRILDHIRRRSANLGGVGFLVLDEVDEMLERGFIDEIGEISGMVSPQGQTFVCSATMPDAVVRLVRRIMKNPVRIEIDGDTFSIGHIEQYIVKVSAEKRREALAELLRQANPYLGIVFCTSRASAAGIGEWLGGQGFSLEVLQGELSQAKRLQVMRMFRKARVQLLVATDLAARGLDVEGVSHVFNYELPLDAQQYIHRVGRTGRAGADGVAVTIYTPEESARVAKLEHKLGVIFSARNLSGQEVTRIKKKAAPKTKTRSAGAGEKNGGSRKKAIKGNRQGPGKSVEKQKS